MKVFDYLMKVRKERGAGYLPLIDPEKASEISFEEILNEFRTTDVDGILVGGSTLSSVDLNGVIKKIKTATDKPVIIFPGGHYQVSPDADAIFFLSLLSGRNPQFLVEEQVKAALTVKKYSLETIPVAYLLIESGNLTSVERISQTKPLQRDNKELILSHVLTGEYFGLKMCYMDGGSGAKYSVPEDVIKETKEISNLPLIIGRGIRDPEEARKKVKAGADFIATGSIIEKNPHLLSEFSKAIHKP